MRIAKLFLLSAGLSLAAANYALADAVVIAATGFPADSISKADFARTFTGKPITLPGGKAARPINLKPGATRDQMQTTLLEKTQSQMEKHWAKLSFSGGGSPPDEVDSDAEMVRRVAADPTAIGYVDEKSVTAGVKVLKVQ